MASKAKKRKKAIKKIRKSLMRDWEGLEPLIGLYGAWLTSRRSSQKSIRAIRKVHRSFRIDSAFRVDELDDCWILFSSWEMIPFGMDRVVGTVNVSEYFYITTSMPDLRRELDHVLDFDWAAIHPLRRAVIEAMPDDFEEIIKLRKEKHGR